VLPLVGRLDLNQRPFGPSRRASGADASRRVPAVPGVPIRDTEGRKGRCSRYYFGTTEPDCRGRLRETSSSAARPKRGRGRPSGSRPPNSRPTRPSWPLGCPAPLRPAPEAAPTPAAPAPAPAPAQPAPPPPAPPPDLTRPAVQFGEPATAAPTSPPTPAPSSRPARPAPAPPSGGSDLYGPRPRKERRCARPPSGSPRWPP
jgi:hypothetical protein